MSSHYDTYDYPSYWKGREYEHEAEVIALTAFLAKIPRIKKILEVGAGYGRLTPTYMHRAEKIILSDPSTRHLASARKKILSSKVSFVQSSLETLPEKIRANSIDVLLFVRVLHHIRNVKKAFEIVGKILKKNGFLILEFPNKRHLKAVIGEFFRGNLTYLFDIFPKDLRSKRSVLRDTLPFINYHPDEIRYLLKKGGFRILETRSVSNVRSPFLKKYLPKEVILFFEKHLQRVLSYINFGPSIFILAQKK